MVKQIKQIVILNGGEGKRVKSVSNNKPKCLIEFNGKSFLKLQINFLHKKGFSEFLILTKKKNNLILSEVNTFKKKNIKIILFKENNKLGTGGAIKNAYSKLKKNFSVIYGDSWLDLNFSKVNKSYLKSDKNLLITAISKNYVNHKPNLLIKNNKVISYSKKNFLKNNFVEYGYQVFHKKVFKNFDKKIFDLSLILNKLIKDNDLELYLVNKKFYEIGSLKGIETFKKYLKKNG